MSISPPLTSIGAGNFVGAAHANAMSFGSSAFNTAQSLIGDLTSLEFSPVAFDLSFDVPGALLSGFDRPEPPVGPGPGDFAVDADIPDLPVLGGVSVPSFGSAPVFTKDAPELNFSTKPSPFAGALPDDPPDLFPVAIPDTPDLEFPVVPTLEELNLPAPPDVIQHEFLADRPSFDVDVPDGQFIFAPKEYSSELLDEVTAEVRRLLQGGTGLPPAIEQMLFDRARGREDDTADKAVMEALDEWASRGFSQPSGLIDKRLARVRQNNQSQSNALNRELTIRVHEIEIENLRFAIERGIALEGIFTQLFIQSEELALRAAQITADIVIAIFRARVEVFNAQVQAFRVDAEVFQSLIRAELAKVEVYRAQIEGERVRGEINQQRIAIYRALLDGVNTLVDVYNAQVRAAQTVAQTNETLIRGYVARIDAFRSEVQAKQAEFEAWGTEVRGEVSKMTGYEAETRAFSARVSAFASGVEASAIIPRVEIENNRLTVEQFRAQIDAVRAKIAAEGERIRGISSKFGAEAQIYTAEGAIRSAEAETNTRQFLALLEESRLGSEQAFRAADLDARQLLGFVEQRITALRGAAQAASQLASAALAAINATASVSESASASNNWSQSFSVTQQID